MTLTRTLVVALAFLALSALVAWAVYDGVDVPLFHIRPLAWWEVGKVCVDFLLGMLLVGALVAVAAYIAGMRHRARIEAAGRASAPVVVTVNGREVDVAAMGLLTHGDLVELAGLAGPCSVTYRSPYGRESAIGTGDGVCPAAGAAFVVERAS